MNFISILVLICTFVSFVSSSADLRDIIARIASESYDASSDASALVDKVLEAIRIFIKKEGYDKIELPDEINKFDRRIFGIPFSGDFSLYNGSFSGLSSIKRAGDCNYKWEPNLEILIICEIELLHPSLFYNGVAKFMKLGPNITVNGTLSKVISDLVIRLYYTGEEKNQDKKESTLKARVEKLKVKTTGVLTTEIKGLGILNFLAEIISDFIGNTVKPALVKLSEDRMKEIINTFLANMHFPRNPNVDRLFMQKPTS